MGPEISSAQMPNLFYFLRSKKLFYQYGLVLEQTSIIPCHTIKTRQEWIRNSPVIPGVTVPMPQPPPIVSGRPASTSSVFEGALPSRFVPQTITNTRGVTTPISQAAVTPLPPVIPSAPGSRAGQHQPRSATLSRPTSIYGNPLYQVTERNDGPPTLLMARRRFQTAWVAPWELLPSDLVANQP